MKRITYALFLSLSFWVIACNKEVQPEDPKITVIGFSPQNGTSGTEVTITGTNFSSVAADNTVKFNGVAARVISASATSLKVEVPKRAGAGKITVTKASQTVTSAADFGFEYKVMVSTFAGDGTNTYAEGTGTAAKLSGLSGMTIDNQDNLYCALTNVNCIQKITPSAVVTKFVGEVGTPGHVDGSGNVVRLGFPQQIVYDKIEGGFYITDVYAYISRIRKITAAGVVSTVAGGGTNTAETVSNPLEAKLHSDGYPYGVSNLAIDANKNIYVTDYDNHYIRKISTTGITTLAGKRGTPGYQDGQGTNAWFSGCSGIATTADGNLLVWDNVNYRIRKVTPAGLVTTFAGNGTNSQTDTDNPLTATLTDKGAAMAQDAKGNTYFVDNNQLRIITDKGKVITLTKGGSGFADGPGATAKFNGIGSIVIDSQGNLFVSDGLNFRVRKIIIE